MHYRSSRIVRLTGWLVAVLVLLAVATYFFRETLYRGLSGWTAESAVRSSMATIITDPGLVLLVLITAVLAAWTWLRDRVAFVRLACAGVGVIAAYMTSEVIKRIVQQERPCNTFEVATVLVCREPGNFSWPSNHTVIAVSFAAACIVAVPAARKLVGLVITLAVLIGLSRVAVGMHYFHDVFAGMALGIAVVTIVSLTLTPFLERLTANWNWLWGTNPQARAAMPAMSREVREFSLSAQSLSAHVSASRRTAQSATPPQGSRSTLRTAGVRPAGSRPAEGRSVRSRPAGSRPSGGRQSRARPAPRRAASDGEILRQEDIPGFPGDHR